MTKAPVLLLKFSLFLATVSSPAIATDIGSLCNGSMGLTSGQWAEYAAHAFLIEQDVKSRFAIVGAEADHYWFEFEAESPMGDSVTIIKILIPGWPYDPKQVTRAIMQLPRIEGMDAIPPMEMPPRSVRGENMSDPLLMVCEEIGQGDVETFQESVTVAAGTFSATRVPVRQLGKDVWVSTAVPFGIVKIADDEGFGVSLTAYGNDARTAITETPQALPGMPEN
jgi:hypothetical protein